MAAVTPTPQPGKIEVGKALWEGRLAYLYILPAFLIMAFITFYPIVYQVWMAFTNFELRHLRLQNPEFVGFENFVRVLGGLPIPNYSFGRILVFNIVWTFVNVFLHVTLGIIPWALPSLVSGMVWNNMWHERFGAVNLLLQEL